MLYESMPRSFFIHAGGTPALPVTPSHRLFNPALLAGPIQGLNLNISFATETSYECRMAEAKTGAGGTSTFDIPCSIFDILISEIQTFFPTMYPS
jgi:hypothetical protein